MPGVNSRHIAEQIKDLDSELFAVREKATKEIQNLGELAEPALRKLLIDPPSLEVRLRAKVLLEKITTTFAAPERLQALRAVEALEYMGTPEARGLLRELSRGAIEARLTREAIASLDRLERQKASGP